MKLLRLILLCGLALGTAGSSTWAAQGESQSTPGVAEPSAAVHGGTTERGVLAYRAGDYGAALIAWQQQLEEATSSSERARLAYNLGGAAFRQGNPEQAVGWYTAALRLQPRAAKLWHNLELARSAAGLEPADRGDLDSTLRRLISSLTSAESERLVLYAIALLALCLLGEALRGSSLWRRLSLCSGTLLFLTLWPLGWNVLHESSRPMLVTAPKGAPARKMPSRTAKVLTTLESGMAVERLDAMPDWIKVQTTSGEELWVRERELFDLDL